jgi:site-specific DNA-methyltransferase (adenine-specific)
VIDLRLADCRELLRTLPPNSVHVVVTDPPYEIGFMGHGWDSSGIAFDRELWTEVLRVLTPGGHVFASGATKTWHWLACAMELAGFEPRDSIAWIQGEGMAHGANIGKRIDKEAGAVREVVGIDEARARQQTAKRGTAALGDFAGSGGIITAPATPEAAAWEGWNTTLAPKHEPIVVMRKPIERGLTEAANVLKWGTGALNIDACRLPGGKRVPGSVSKDPSGRVALGQRGRETGRESGHDPNVGRWAPNVALDEAAAAALRARVGKRATGGGVRNSPGGGRASGKRAAGEAERVFEASTHGPDAFFFCPKAPTGERDNGCLHLRWMRDPVLGWRPAEPGETPDLVGNPHPTVKPLALMRWLLRLGTPPGGRAFEPFVGSGTTAVAAIIEGIDLIGCDLTPWALTVAKARTAWAEGRGPELAADDEQAHHVPVQGSLFG